MSPYSGACPIQAFSRLRAAVSPPVAASGDSPAGATGSRPTDRLDGSFTERGASNVARHFAAVHDRWYGEKTR